MVTVPTKNIDEGYEVHRNLWIPLTAAWARNLSVAGESEQSACFAPRPRVGCDQLIRSGRGMAGVRRRGVRNDDATHRLLETQRFYLRRESVSFGIAVRLCRATDECASNGSRK